MPPSSSDGSPRANPPFCLGRRKRPRNPARPEALSLAFSRTRPASTNIFCSYRGTIRADKKWPVILYLHGAGERGTDGVLQTTVGLGPYVKERAATFPFFVVFPQCEDTQGRILTAWSPSSPDGRRALAILDSVEREFAIDSHRCVLTGWSMGGYGTWSLGAAEPKRWSALVPVAGGGDPAWAPKLKDIPIWAFQGANDQVVPPRAVPTDDRSDSSGGGTSALYRGSRRRPRRLESGLQRQPPLRMDARSIGDDSYGDRRCRRRPSGSRRFGGVGPTEGTADCAARGGRPLHSGRHHSERVLRASGQRGDSVAGAFGPAAHFAQCPLRSD